MRVNRLELIEKLKAIINDLEYAAAGRRALALIEAESAEKDYFQEHHTDWVLFVGNIQSKMKSGRAVTPEDVPEGLRDCWQGINIFKPATFRESDYVPRVGHLNNLLAVLESSPDEFVTTNALDRIGAPLRELMKP